MSQEMDQGHIANVVSPGSASRVDLGKQVNEAASHLKLGDVRGMYISSESSKVATAGIVNKNPTLSLTSPDSQSTLKADLGINAAAEQIGSEVRQHALQNNLSPETAAWMESYAKNMARGLGGQNSNAEYKKTAEKAPLDPETQASPNGQAQRDPNSIRIENPLVRTNGQSLADASKILNPFANSQPQPIAMTTDGQFISAAHRTDQALREADMLKLGVAAGLGIAAMMIPSEEQIAAEKKRAEEEKRLQEQRQKTAADTQHRQALELKDKLAVSEAQMIALQGRESAELDAQQIAAAAQTERIRAAQEGNRPPAGLEGALLKDKVEQLVLGHTEYGQENCLGMSLLRDDIDSTRRQLAAKTS